MIKTPRRFKLIRWEGSPKGHIASGVEFEDGTCTLRWRTSVPSIGFYNSWDDMMAIHGHGLSTICHWLDDPPKLWTRGANACGQDDMENVPFASVGGLEARPNLVVPPSYIEEHHALMYLNGYICHAIEMYDLVWATCEFDWKHALTIKPGGEVEVP